MAGTETESRYVFPRWANYLLPAIAVTVLGGMVYAPLLVYSAATPRTKDVGYQPTQPVEYSHALHVGQLGIDCRYCHNTVEEAGYAAIPPTQTCMNCHVGIKPDTPKMLPVRESYVSGMPIEWVKVHDLPDYVFFDHRAHVNRGVGCSTCHGRVDRMEKVYQANTLSMAWCLDCHRQPERYLRPQDAITKMDWQPPENQLQVGLELKKQNNIRNADYMMNCSICHR